MTLQASLDLLSLMALIALIILLWNNPRGPDAAA